MSFTTWVSVIVPVGSGPVILFGTSFFRSPLYRPALAYFGSTISNTIIPYPWFEKSSLTGKAARRSNRRRFFVWSNALPDDPPVNHGGGTLAF